MNQHQSTGSPKDKGYEMVNVESNEKVKKFKSRLIEAASDGNLAVLNECLDKGGDIFEKDDTFGASVLHYAVYNDNFEKAIQCTEELLNRALLNFNVDGLKRLIEQEDANNKTSLFWALANGNYTVVRMLLNRGATLGFKQPNNESAFHVAAKLENHLNALNCTEVLLDVKYYGSDPEKLKQYLNSEEGQTSRTALHRAAISGNSDLIRLLISNGADPTKVDFVKSNAFHHSVGNADEVRAEKCTEILMQAKLTEDWDDVKSKLLYSFNAGGKCPIHIAARRGFSKILEMMPEYFLVAEGKTGFTVLHSCASLGSQKKAEKCVEQVLNSVLPEEKAELLNLQDAEGFTALYLAAKHRNVGAAKLLLSAGSAFDIKSNRGKTSLEKVYEKVPEAVNVLLEKAIANSGYLTFLSSINTIAELDFGPILGYSSSRANVHKEAEELAKVCSAKFEERKSVLNHILVRIFIHLKWERVKGFFIFFRLLHILWFLGNCFFLVTMYRVECPYKAANAKPYSWTALRPVAEDERNNTKSCLEECEIGSGLRIAGSLNLIAVAVYMLSQLHQSIQRFHWMFRPMKDFSPKASWMKKFHKTISYYPCLFLNIFPCWPFVISMGIIITTLPAFGTLLFDETSQYIISGLMALFIWLAIYLELGKFPKFRVYINLLMRSTKTLLFAIAVTAPILFGFANVFVILIPGEPSFSSAAQSFVKVITFMIGELDYEGLFYGEKETVFLGIVMLALAVFIVIIVVLLVNFLIGLAAEEIRDFGERATIWKLCTQLEQIAMLESFLDESIPLCGRDFLIEHLMLMPPEPDRESRGGFKQTRKARIDIPSLPKEMQKELHDLNFKTIEE